jgi:hypothetical protein
MNHNSRQTRDRNGHRCRADRLGARVQLRVAHACGWAAGRLIVQAAKAFVRAGDGHEVAHCCAALQAGNSEHCEPAHCQLEHVHPGTAAQTSAPQNARATPAGIDPAAEGCRS